MRATDTDLAGADDQESVDEAAWQVTSAAMPHLEVEPEAFLPLAASTRAAWTSDGDLDVLAGAE